jgi:Ser/Thr protein kinase RdoA (MazF antagonist)
MSARVPQLGPRNPFELWQPTGAWPQARDREQSDVLVVDMRGARSREAIDRMVSAGAAELSDEGLMWLVVPRRWRGRAARQVRRRRLVNLVAVVLVPASVRPAHLVPLEPPALGDAAVRHLGMSKIVGAALSRAARSRAGRALLWRGVPGGALLAASTARTAPLAWLDCLDSRPTATAAIAVSSAPGCAVAVLLRYPVGVSAPDLAVKVALDEAAHARLHRERDALVALASGAVAAGARVPSPRRGGPPWALVTDVLPGRPAAAVLARQPGRLEEVGSSVAAWVQEWAVRTASPMTVTPRLLHEMLLQPLATVANAGVITPRYERSLQQLAARVQGDRLPFTAAHNDLTMANVLIAEDGIGIVDWENAARSGLPLRDLWYALVDALVRAQGISHASGLAQLVLAGRETPRRLAVAPAVLARTLALGEDQALTAFHACWLAHAANEVRRGTMRGPFVEIIRALAEGAVAWDAVARSMARR